MNYAIVVGFMIPRLDAQSLESLSACLKVLKNLNPHPLVEKQFVSMYTRYINGDTGRIKWQDIQPLEAQDSVPLEALKPEHRNLGLKAMNQVGFVKLNGGLGTSMGCKGAKSAIVIKGNDTFLDLIANQVLDLRAQYNAQIPLIFLNSYNTTAECHSVLDGKIDFIELIQHQFPRIDAQSKVPTQFRDDHENWNPPGHGDLLLSLITTGALHSLKEKGITHLFVSNADNLGPSIHPDILGYMIANDLEFVMETTPKSKEDVKGGTLIRYQGHLHLLERAQVEPEHLSDFEDISEFKVFNTNNIWIKLSALEKILSEPDFELPLIANPKTIHGTPCVQLESALGSAIYLFKSASILVGRNRFLPVKKTSDLLIIASDLIQKNEHENLEFENKHIITYPHIELSSEYNYVDYFHSAFTKIPSLKALAELKIKGPLQVNEGVVLKGKVAIEVHASKPLQLKNEVLENVKVTVTPDGNRIDITLK